MSKIFVSLINFAVLFISINWYGADEYSYYSLVYLFSLTVVTASSTWFTQAYLRFGYSGVSEITSYYKLSNLFIFFFVLLYGFFSGSSILNTVILLVLCFTQNMYLVGRVILQKLRRVRGYLVYDTLRMFLILLTSIVMYKFHPTHHSLILAFCIGNLLYSLIFLYQDTPNKNEKKVLKINLRKWIKFGVPVSLWLTIASFQMFIDRWIVSYYEDASLTGNYAFYYDLILKVCALFVLPVANAIYPIFIEKKKELPPDGFLALVLAGICFFIAIFAGGISLFLHEYVVAIFALKYVFNSFTFSVFVAGIILWQLAMIYHKPLELKGKTLVMVVNIAICMIISFVLNFTLFPVYGIDILPFSLFLSALLYLLFNLILSRR